jgi:ribosomal protein S10
MDARIAALEESIAQLLSIAESTVNQMSAVEELASKSSQQSVVKQAFEASPVRDKYEMMAQSLIGAK